MHRLIFIILLFTFFQSGYSESAKNFLQQVLTATKKVRHFESYSRMIEKTDSKVTTNVSFSKISYEPFRVYMTNIAPDAGMQTLYNPKLTEDKLFVKIPPINFITLKIDPNSSLARGKFHHPIEYSGTRFAVRILENIAQNIGDYTFSFSTNVFHGRKMIVSVLNTKDFRYIPYKITQKETMQNLCSRLLVNEYLVLTRNNNISHYEQVLNPGTIIQIPNHFFKKLQVFIDAETYLPVVEKIWDETGFLEEYDMYQVTIKTSFDPQAFLPMTYGLH